MENENGADFRQQQWLEEYEQWLADKDAQKAYQQYLDDLEAMASG